VAELTDMARIIRENASSVVCESCSLNVYRYLRYELKHIAKCVCSFLQKDTFDLNTGFTAPLTDLSMRTSIFQAQNCKWELYPTFRFCGWYIKLIFEGDL